MNPLQLLFLLLLPLAVSQSVFGIPTIFLTTVKDNNNGNVAYLAKLKLAIPPASSPTEAGFLLDTNAQQTLISSNCTRLTTKAELWSLVIGDSGFVADASDVPIGEIAVVCRKKQNQNVAALGSSNSSLPFQVVSKLDQRPLRFAYALQESSGTLFFGRKSWVQFTSIVPERREDISFVTMPLQIAAASGGYQVKLTDIGFKSSFLTKQQEIVQISSTEHFTTLPSKMYSFLLGKFEQEVKQRKFGQVSSSSYGKLSKCYGMSKAELSSFPNVTMEFGSSKAQWIVPAEKYLVEKPGSSSSVFCFAYLEAAAGRSGVIGTLQQQGRVIEFDLKNKTLSVSLPLVGGLISP